MITTKQYKDVVKGVADCLGVNSISDVSNILAEVLYTYCRTHIALNSEIVGIQKVDLAQYIAEVNMSILEHHMAHLVSDVKLDLQPK